MQHAQQNVKHKVIAFRRKEERAEYNVKIANGRQEGTFRVKVHDSPYSTQGHNDLTKHKTTRIIDFLKVRNEDVMTIERNSAGYFIFPVTRSLTLQI